MKMKNLLLIQEVLQLEVQLLIFGHIVKNIHADLEFDGDFLESIRYFDPESQRSSGRVEYVTLASSIESADINYSSDIFDYLNNPIVFASSYELII